MRTTIYVRPRSFASPARTARTTRTKRKRKRRRNEADLPVTGGGQAGLTPLNLRYILDSHMAPYGACEVVQRTVRSSAVTPKEN